MWKSFLIWLAHVLAKIVLYKEPFKKIHGKKTPSILHKDFFKLSNLREISPQGQCQALIKLLENYAIA